MFSENALYDTIITDTRHYAFVLTHRLYKTRSELSPNCKVGVWDDTASLQGEPLMMGKGMTGALCIFCSVLL